MIGIFLISLLGGCSKSEAPPSGNEALQALVFNAPEDGERPGFTLQAMIPEGASELVEPPVLFPALLQAIGPAMVECGITAESAGEFLWTGDLALGAESGLVFTPRQEDPVASCLAAAATARGVAGPEVALILPVAWVLHPVPGD